MRNNIVLEAHPANNNNGLEAIGNIQHAIPLEQRNTNPSPLAFQTINVDRGNEKQNCLYAKPDKNNADLNHNGTNYPQELSDIKHYGSKEKSMGLKTEKMDDRAPHNYKGRQGVYGTDVSQISVMINILQVSGDRKYEGFMFNGKYHGKGKITFCKFQSKSSN